MTGIPTFVTKCTDTNVTLIMHLFSATCNHTSIKSTRTRFIIIHKCTIQLKKSADDILDGNCNSCRTQPGL